MSKTNKANKVLVACIAVCLCVIIALGGTIAWLTSTDEDVNVMTLGNVEIEQIEQEWNDDKTELVDFKQGKPLYPYVGSLGWTNKDVDNGAYRQFTMENVVDKYVSVENTGKSDAYVRTVFAFEMGGYTTVEEFRNKIVGFSRNVEDGDEFDFPGAWVWGTPFVAQIEGKNYMIWEAVHENAVAGGETTIPSLLQVYMNKACDNAEVQKVDGNGNGMYDILAVSQAVQTNGFTDAQTALNEAFKAIDKNNHPWVNGVNNYPIIVTNEEELAEALAEATDAKSGDVTVYLANDVALTEDWTPITVDGYHGAGIVTLEGQGYTITGLNAPLFDGGFAGKSGIVIRDLTIADSEIESAQTQGAGAFISCVDSMTTITLENCHLLNSTVDAPKARTGGLIGWTSGYSKQGDGPVKTYVTISDCSVIGCKITGTAVGGINGHAGASDWTYTTIENCKVMNNELISYDDGDWRVGDVIGTANVGEVTITGTIYGGNTKTQAQASSQHDDSISELVGRFVPGTTGKLTVDGTVSGAIASTNDELNKAISDGAAYIALDDGNYIIPDSAQRRTLTIVGNGNTVIATQDDGSYEGCDYSLEGSTVTFENITINTDSTTYTGYARLDATYNNCTINGTYTLYGDSEFNNCTFNISGDAYNIWTWGAPTATFNDCTFNTSGKAILLYGGTNTVLKATNCVFNDANDNADVNNKAAIEVGTDWTTDTKEIIATNCTVNGFDITNKGINTNSTLWGNKNSMSTDRLNVVIDGVDVY